MNYSYKSLDEGNCVFGISIDLKKAFDTVQHKVLLYKLQHYGICRLAFQWFESYLSKKKQFLVINNTSHLRKATFQNVQWFELHLSRKKQFLVINNTQSDISYLCEYGVSQGSVLGPMLFLLFINDIHRSRSEITIKLFADDTNCIISDKDFNSLEKLLEGELNKLQKWINANKLTINFDPKTLSYCIFKPRGKCSPINFDRGLKMGSNILKYKETTKFLGLILDGNLTWKSHIKELNQKLIKYTGIFSKVCYCLPSTCAKLYIMLSYSLDLTMDLKSI